MLYAVMFVAGALWTALLIVILAAFSTAGRYDRETEQQLSRRNVSYIRRVV